MSATPCGVGVMRFAVLGSSPIPRTKTENPETIKVSGFFFCFQGFAGTAFRCCRYSQRIENALSVTIPCTRNAHENKNRGERYALP